MYKVVHIEPTDVCQAACPLCARETDAEFDKQQHHHLTVEQIKQHFSEDTIRGLDKMFMCGNYGDPAAGRHTLEIYRYFRSINPTIVLGMNTNGAVQNIAWWGELAGILDQPQDYVASNQFTWNYSAAGNKISGPPEQPMPPPEMMEQPT